MRVGMNAHGTQICAETRLHERSDLRRQRTPASVEGSNGFFERGIDDWQGARRIGSALHRGRWCRRGRRRATCGHVGHAHHLIRDPIRFLLEVVLRVAHGQLRLQDPQQACVAELLSQRGLRRSGRLRTCLRCGLRRLFPARLHLLNPRGFAPRTPLRRRSRGPLDPRSAPAARLAALDSRRPISSREASPLGLPYAVARGGPFNPRSAPAARLAALDSRRPISSREASPLGLPYAVARGGPFNPRSAPAARLAALDSRISSRLLACGSLTGLRSRRWILRTSTPLTPRLELPSPSAWSTTLLPVIDLKPRSHRSPRAAASGRSCRLPRRAQSHRRRWRCSRAPERRQVPPCWRATRRRRIPRPGGR